MKNGDLPAYPEHHVFEDCGIDGSSGPHLVQTVKSGFTKRETFAMNAPDAPTWFKHHLHKADLLYRQAESAGIAEGGSYLFFAWRTYYADKLLAELERSK